MRFGFSYLAESHPAPFPWEGWIAAARKAGLEQLAEFAIDRFRMLALEGRARLLMIDRAGITDPEEWDHYVDRNDFFPSDLPEIAGIEKDLLNRYSSRFTCSPVAVVGDRALLWCSTDRWQELEEKQLLSRLRGE